MRLTMDVTLEVEVQGSYQAGLRARPRADGVWEPGEGPSIEGMRVMLVGAGKPIDITSALPDDKLRDLEEDGLELYALNV